MLVVIDRVCVQGTAVCILSVLRHAVLQQQTHLHLAVAAR